MKNTEAFNERLAALAPEPGVYLFKNNRGEIIYVGKAAALRNRVRSYFQRSSGRLDPKTQELKSQIVDFEVIRTATPAEALILENELIKRHQPRYNVMLKDGKTYPYIRITNEEWPRVISTRRIVHDGSTYFGPYTSAGSVHRLLDLLKRLFPYRACDIEITGRAERPCLYFHIGRCLGPCTGVADRDEYMRAIEGVKLFLNGRGEELIPAMRAEMEAAAENLDFERAAKLRDDISAIEHVLERQNIVSDRGDDIDVLAVAQTPGGQAGVQAIFVRNGKILGSEHFPLAGTRVDDDPAQLLETFVGQYYEDAAVVPGELLLQYELPEIDTLQAFLEQRRGRKVTITIPQRGRKRRLLEMAIASAEENLKQSSLRWLNNEQKLTAALTELSDALSLPGVPRRIECYDISTLQGTNTVASMVVFENGKPSKKEYRRFSIKEVEGQDDFASMHEVLTRRFKRSLDQEQTESWRTMPDLVIVDGGKGQLSSAMRALSELGVDVPIAALAKENEELFLPGESLPVILPRDSQALYLVQRIRDEAHRFAVTYQRRKRTKSAFKSELDDLPGVGPKRKRALIRSFGSVKKIREATVDEIAAVEGIGPRLAREIHETLNAR
ncbi:MAG TPA: excinuclease ABC subunit UvrC [Thermomicrobiales bacterium]|nr:excinuclease ABC subunit UvrC [Thermomicrobiales bacterium]